MLPPSRSTLAFLGIVTASRPAPDNYLDITRLREDTGFRPEFDVERTVSDYADWLKRHDH